MEAIRDLHRLDPISFPEWTEWLLVLALSGVILVELYKFVQCFFERVVVEGTHLTYYNMFGVRKVSVDLGEVKEIDMVRGPKWNVFTPQGRFSFNHDLRNYQRLIEQFRNSGTAINVFRAQL